MLLAAGCATPIELVPKSAAVTAGVNLSGYWVLVDDAPRSAWRRASRESVSVFLETGSSLKVTQTDHGLFLSFDRAVVEEFRFGENRVVNVGPVEARRVSGWEGRGYVVETLDAVNAILREEYRLDGNGKRLIRNITIVRREETLVDIEQRFARDSGR